MIFFLAPPIFVDVGNRFMMKLLQLPHMENIEIRCNASSAPHEYEPVVIQWMKNGKNIKKKKAITIYHFHVDTCNYCKINIYHNV